MDKYSIHCGTQVKQRLQLIRRKSKLFFFSFQTASVTTMSVPMEEHVLETLIMLIASVLHLIMGHCVKKVGCHSVTYIVHIHTISFKRYNCYHLVTYIFLFMQ